jgi:hypothetical protein
MADQDDFSFDEQDSDSEEWYEEEPEKKKKKSGGSRSRLLFLLLLLVAIAGGAYYFLMMPQDDDGPAAPPKAVVSVKKKTVKMPVRQKVSKQAPAPAENVNMAEKAPDKKSVEVAPKGPAPVKMPVVDAPKPVQKQQGSAPVTTKVVEKPAPAPAKPVSEPAKQVFEKPEATKPAMVSGAAAGAYSLTAGTYLLDSSVKSVSKKIRALGYEPVMTPVQRKVTMTRLKLGSYSHAQAAAKKAELKSLAPGVFGIRKGDKETVYVGSYAVLDKARRFADSLYAKGIKVEEEPIQVTKTLQRVTFGSFADSAAATSAGRQAAAKGIEAKVIKNR